MEERKIKIVLADRDTLYLTKLKRALERKGDMEVVGVTSDGVEATEMAHNLKADVVILDILLGSKDGIWVLEQFKEKKVPSLNIVVSAMDTDSLVRKTIALGADYYMAKPIQGDLLVDRIYQLLGMKTIREKYDIETRQPNILTVKPNKEKTTPTPLQPESTSKLVATSHKNEVQKEVSTSRIHTLKNSFGIRNDFDGEKKLEFEISSVLGRMGIPASIRGYHFLRSAIMMAVEKPELLSGITKGLYPDVGKEYKTTGSKVERAIRHAIESAWKKNGRAIYFEVSGCFFSEKPTNGQFIADMTEYFKMITQQTA